MQTTPTDDADDALLEDLFERSEVLVDLNGPQIEAWVSGLFPLFGEGLDVGDVLEACNARQTPVAALLYKALIELAPESAPRADELVANVMPPQGVQIGSSTMSTAWTVQAPFGQTVVIGFENGIEIDPEDDARHSILVELGDDGTLEDLQLAGPPEELLAEAGAEDDRVLVAPVPVAEACAMVTQAWPTSACVAEQMGPGVSTNQRFVRRRFDQAGTSLPPIVMVDRDIDICRGLDEADCADANRAARSTLQAAIGQHDVPDDLTPQHDAWISVVHGTAGVLSERERDGLLWLEWADWLGAGIGMVRAGADAAVSGGVLVDHVNRCPEVSSTIDKKDRDYAEWAFSVALDLLADTEVVADAKLTPDGLAALPAALFAAWSD